MNKEFLVRVYRLILVICLSLVSLRSMGEILHLELGAGNSSWGREIKVESDKRYLYLVKVVTALIDKYGSSGIIYLNDIDSDALNKAQKHLKAWLNENGYQKIEVRTIIGDYSRVELPLVRTANMGNPGFNQLPSFPGQMFEGMTNNDEIKDGILRVAGYSESGLTISTYYYKNMEVFRSLVSPLQWSLIEDEQTVFEYFWPEGQSFYDKFKKKPKYMGYRIRAIHPNCKLLFF